MVMLYTRKQKKKTQLNMSTVTRMFLQTSTNIVKNGSKKSF